MYEHRDKWYLMMGVDLAEYRNHMRGARRNGRRFACRRRNFARLPAAGKLVMMLRMRNRLIGCVMAFAVVRLCPWSRWRRSAQDIALYDGPWKATENK